MTPIKANHSISPLEKVFQLNEHGTTVKTEIMAGITTFMTMAYMLLHASTKRFLPYYMYSQYCLS